MSTQSRATWVPTKNGKRRIMIMFRVPSKKLREIIEPESIKEESPVKEPSEGKESPAPSIPQEASNSNGDNASDSNAATPAADGTPAPSVMGPPTEGPKKKGVKRAANGNIDGTPKPRGKPGPKKKPRLEDGTIDHSGSTNRASGAHKLGPKANQGAINAGLRALDRSGKPCRKWQKGGFTLKSFTGVVWEIPRWTAPPKKSTDSTEDSATTSVDNSSGKENKENGQEGNSVSNSNSGVDVEMQSVHSANVPSPAPLPIAAAS